MADEIDGIRARQRDGVHNNPNADPTTGGKPGSSGAVDESSSSDSASGSASGGADSKKIDEINKKLDDLMAALMALPSDIVETLKGDC